MKQMRSILAPLLMLLTGVLMTSCDDEQETAMMLLGHMGGTTLDGVLPGPLGRLRTDLLHGVAL